MTAPWALIAALAAGSALLKAGGAALGRRRSVPGTIGVVLACLPPALLAGLIVTGTFVVAGHQLAADSRAAGLAAAGVAVYFRAPALAVIGIAVAVTALAATY